MAIEFSPAEARDVAGIFEVRTSVTENLLSRAELAERGITEASITAMIAGGPCAWVAARGRISSAFR